MVIQKKTKISSIRKKLTSSGILILYAVIMLEGILMATPFALYLYSVYFPFLEILQQSILTAWISSFFFRHVVVETNSAFLEIIGRLWLLFPIGLIGFFLFAFQVYWAKFRRKGLVNNFVYKFIRHPQYLFFMMAGFGVLFTWPRMMMLILFTIMSVFYFYLAQFEERKMTAQHPEYMDYMKKTAMFIPGNPGGKLFKLLFGWIPNQIVAHFIAIVSIIAIIFGGAIGLRNHTIANISTTQLPDKHTLAVSVYPHTEQYLRDTLQIAMTSNSVKNALSEQGNVSFISHIMPINYGMLGHFAEVDREVFRNRLLSNKLSIRERIWGTESDKVKVAFAKVDKPGKEFVPLNEIMDTSARMIPVLVADLDLKTGEVFNVSLHSKSQYGLTPQPMF
jgi:protein-S-isoprenylcysteine O-methyltransferase Ste14